MRTHLQLIVLLLGIPVIAQAQRQLEQLDRGLVALRNVDRGVVLSWRLLGTDAPDLAFNVYRSSAGKTVRLNQTPLTGATTWVDSTADFANDLAYFVRTVSVAGEGEASKSFRLPANSPARDYLSIPTLLPEGYHANDASVGDLDGDGQYEIIVHVAGRGRDNSQGGMTDPPIFHAYRLDGTLLWQIQLGKNIREGAHYNPFLVYDFDGDGPAELICRTADGTIDGVGKVIGDPDADWRIPDRSELGTGFGTGPEQRRVRQPRRRVSGDAGKILSGPEYLTVFEGQTGKAIDTVTYVPDRAPGNDSPSKQQQKQIWGDDYGNRIDRFLATVAYLDGQRPTAVMTRGYYTRTVLAAWDFRDGKLIKRWTFDSDKAGPPDNTNPWRGQGNHSIATADVDDDGRDEIIFGAMVIDDDGSGLYSTKLGHGDAQHTGDLNPARPGLETWSIHENDKPAADFIGTEMRAAKSGEILFVGTRGRDVGRGMAADIDPRHPGCEVWGGSRIMLSSDGTAIGPSPRSQNMAIWWDGDLLRELLDGVTINNWDYHAGQEQRLFDGRRHGLAANNGSKSNPCLVADILGDWREELVARTLDNRELRIYVTTEPTDHRLRTLMHDAQYRIGIAWQNVGYNQPAHTRFFLGHGMQPQKPTTIKSER
jgi:rhamnogalacturonan endolyase